MTEQPSNTPDLDPIVAERDDSQAALSVVQEAPPPSGDAAQAGAGTPPVDETPAVDPGEAALAQEPGVRSLDAEPIPQASPMPPNRLTYESQPRTDDAFTTLSEPIDTPAAALAALGPDSGVAPGTVDIVHPVSAEIPAPTHPADVIDAMRTKLAAYGEECLKAVQTEVEYLIRLHPRV